MKNKVSDNARVVQGKDGAVTAAQMAVRFRPPRSNIKALLVLPVKPAEIRHLIIEHHYLHSMPAAPRLCFGVYSGDTLDGAIVFTSGARKGHLIMSAITPQEVATLARLWLHDHLPKNAESRVIGAALRHIARYTDWKLILSYADPQAGHVGTIYQATGWLYLGQQPPASYIDIGEGELLHPRTLYKRYGSNSVGHLRRTGIPAIRQVVGSKHRYAYIPNIAWKWRLKASLQPYPRKGVVMGDIHD